LAAAQPGVAGQGLGGGGAAKGALMTRAELRACLIEQGEQQRRAAELERRRGELDKETAAVRQQLAEVQAERVAFGSWQRASQAFKDKVQQHAERVSLYNQQVKAFQASSPKAEGAERERGQLEAEADALAQAEAAIKAEGEALDATIAKARTSLVGRAEAQASAASAVNDGNRRFHEDAQSHDAAVDSWTRRCGGRPYTIADEKAVRAELR
jgi:predicted  nucleic acid-binding Zn-ribbon protein